MALKKVISSKIAFRSEHVDNGDGTYHIKAIPFEKIPQKEIDMHSLEESMMLLFAAHNELIEKCPKAPTKEEEHEWMIEHCPDYIKQKRAEWQTAYDAAQPAIAAAEKKWRDAEKAWNDHCEWCVANGHDYNTYIQSK